VYAVGSGMGAGEATTVEEDVSEAAVAEDQVEVEIGEVDEEVVAAAEAAIAADVGEAREEE
jgi:hypothetical protein